MEKGNKVEISFFLEQDCCVVKDETKIFTENIFWLGVMTIYLMVIKFCIIAKIRYFSYYYKIL